MAIIQQHIGICPVGIDPIGETVPVDVDQLGVRAIGSCSRERLWRAEHGRGGKVPRAAVPEIRAVRTSSADIFLVVRQSVSVDITEDAACAVGASRSGDIEVRHDASIGGSGSPHIRARLRIHPHGR